MCMRRSRGLLPAAFVLVTAVAACGGGDNGAGTTTTVGTAGSTTTTSEPAPTTAPPDTTTSTSVPTEIDLTPLEGRLDEEGALTLDGALELFAATLAPLPGVTPADAPLDHHGTAILATLAAHLHDLPDDQRAVVERVLYGPDSGVVGLRSPSSELVAEARRAFEAARVHFAPRLGWDIGELVLDFRVLSSSDPDGTRYFTEDEGASATPLYSEDDSGAYVYDECLIRINGDARLDSVSFWGALAHEAFHCFQYVYEPYRTRLPLWIREGGAAYAGEEFSGGTSYAPGWWANWLRAPHKPLTLRSYDAMGVFHLSAAIGADPYRYMGDLLRSRTVGALHELAGPELAVVWGLHYANEPSWGPDYTVRGVSAPSTQPTRQSLALTVDGGQATLPALPPTVTLGAQVYEFTAAGDVLRVAGLLSSGGLRADDGVEVRFPSAQTDICVRPDGCECPEPATTPPHVNTTSTEMFLGVGPAPSPPTVEALSLTAWCGEICPSGAHGWAAVPRSAEPCPEPATTTEPAPPPSDDCLTGNWTITSGELARLYDAVSNATPGISLDASGTIGVSFDGSRFTYTPAFQLTLDTNGLVGTGTVTGTLSGDYAAIGGTITTSAETSTIAATVSINGIEMDASPFLDATLFARPLNSAPYECTPGGPVIHFATPSGRVPISLVPA